MTHRGRLSSSAPQRWRRRPVSSTDDDPRCYVHQSALLALRTEPNNEMRAIDDVLNAFPYKRAAVYVAKEHDTRVRALFGELNFRDLLINPKSGEGALKDVDLVIVHRDARLPAVPHPTVVIKVNSPHTSTLPLVPMPNASRGAANYREKLARFLGAKHRDIVRCVSRA